MKKIFASIAVIAICISFASCNKTKSPDIANDIQAESSKITQTHNEQAEESEEETTKNIVDETNENEVITQNLLNNKINEVRKPTWLPANLEECEMIVSRFVIVLDYYLGEDYYFSYIQAPITHDDIHVDNEGATVTNININGLSGIMITYSTDNRINMFWSDDEYVYEILSELLTYEEVMRIAESIDVTN